MEKINDGGQAPTVKTFDQEKLARCIKAADPIVLEYIESMKRVIEMSVETNNKAIAQIRKLSAHREEG